jgi:hypothetical protein
MARSEEGEYSTYSADEQRRQRAKDQARWLQNVAVEALGHSDERATPSSMGVPASICIGAL